MLHSHGLYGDKDDAAAFEFTVPLGAFGNLGGRSLQQQLVFVGPSSYSTIRNPWLCREGAGRGEGLFHGTANSPRRKEASR